MRFCRSFDYAGMKSLLAIFISSGFIFGVNSLSHYPLINKSHQKLLRGAISREKTHNEQQKRCPKERSKDRAEESNSTEAKETCDHSTHDAQYQITQNTALHCKAILTLLSAGVAFKMHTLSFAGTIRGVKRGAP